MIRRQRPLVPAHRRRILAEPVVAMINVVFLLLIFFLMTAQIVPPSPFDVVLPEDSDAPDATDTAAGTLYISATGVLAFGAARGAEAISQAARAEDLLIAADATLSAQRLAAILAELRAAGAGDLRLQTRGRP